MASKTIKSLIKDTLANLSKEQFEAFVETLLDRKEAPRVKRNSVEDKSRLMVTNVLVSTFKESKAPEVVAEILREINCNDEAEALVKEAAAQCSNPGSSNDEHPVDKHRVTLINKVNNVNPILDELSSKRVIGEEKLAEIRRMPTSYAQIRELCGSLNSREQKDIFYELLNKHEQYLMKELNKA